MQINMLIVVHLIKEKIYMYKLGIDVGGTNIDFALVSSSDELLYAKKIPTNSNISELILAEIMSLVDECSINIVDIKSIQLGTTLALNSLLELKQLSKVGLLRLAGHKPDLPPAYFWSNEQRKAMLAGYRTLDGGRDYDNQILTALHGQQIKTAVEELITEGAESLAIISVFSPLYADDEIKALEIIRRQFALPACLSHTVGTLGFISRENAVICNAALKTILQKQFTALETLLRTSGFQGVLWISNNNGTLMQLEEAIEFPIKTIASGPTNSLLGAAKLAQCNNAIVVDIGGTSTDIGLVENGLPVNSIKGNDIAGISCQLLAPDITALAMGGGSLIDCQNNVYKIGPQSVGASLLNVCQTNGGPEWTLYDVGQRALQSDHHESKQILLQLLTRIQSEIEALVPDADTKPILLVGGGAALIPESLLSRRFVRPKYYTVANAYGAALSEVSAQMDCIIQSDQNIDQSIEQLEQKVICLAIGKGADRESVRIIEKKILPLYYMQQPMYRILMTAAGRFSIVE